MSFMKGDLMAKTRKLVKGLAKAEPVWLKAVEQSPPAVFPRIDGAFPEDVYVKKFFQTNPDSKHEDPVDISGFDQVPARTFGLRVLELKEQGVKEDDAMPVANLEYRARRKEKKMAYSRLKQIARLQGTKPPPNPYPGAIKGIQAEERKFVCDRFFNLKILEIVKQMKATRETQIQDGIRPPGFSGLRQGGARVGGFRRKSSWLSLSTDKISTTSRMTNTNILAARGSESFLTQPAFPCTAVTLPSQCSRRLIFGDLTAMRKSSLNKTSLIATHCTLQPEIDSNGATNANLPPHPIELASCSMSNQLLMSSPNQSHSSSYTKGLVFDKGPANSWDSAATGSPVVKRYIGDDEERWYMWYHGSSDEHQSSDSVGLALSKNGVHWARGAGAVRSCGDSGLVMNCQESWWAFDTKGIRPSELVIMSSPMYSSVYWIYYTGYSSDEVRLPEDISIPFQADSRASKIYKSLPGLACSQDGRHWGRIEGDHHSGALLDVGSAEEWDSSFIAAPNVVIHGSDDLRMYYHSFDARSNHFGIGVARSRDGIRWVKLGKIIGGGARGSFDELGSMNPNVVRNSRNGKYMMAYEGMSSTGTRSIGLAESSDGLTHWTRLCKDPILKPSCEDSWDNTSVGAPCLVQMDGYSAGWRLYYEGVGQEGRTGIGMAIISQLDVEG